MGEVIIKYDNKSYFIKHSLELFIAANMFLIKNVVS